jgi:drug/metabolite transporter (DMT)-like permease
MLIALSLIWGASFMFIEVMLEEMGPVATGWLRLGTGALLLVAVLAARGIEVPRTRRFWATAIAVGVTASAAPLVLIPWGQQEIDSSLAAILNSGMPLFTAIFAHMAIVDERLTPAKTAGLLVGFAGVVIVIGPDLLDLGAGGTQGQLAVILATVGYAAGAVISRRMLEGVEPTALATAQTVVGFIVLTPILVAGEGVPNVAAFSTKVLFATAAVGFGATGVALIIYYWLLANTDATRAALVTYLIPISAIGWGVLVLDEGLEPAFIPGLALIIGGIILVNRTPSGAQQAAEAPSLTASGGR